MKKTPDSKTKNSMSNFRWIGFKLIPIFVMLKTQKK